jgi:hypothetical protein
MLFGWRAAKDLRNGEECPREPRTTTVEPTLGAGRLMCQKRAPGPGLPVLWGFRLRARAGPRLRMFRSRIGTREQARLGASWQGLQCHADSVKVLDYKGIGPNS